MTLSESQQHQAERCMRELDELKSEHPGDPKHELALQLFHAAYESLLLREPHGSLEGRVIEDKETGEQWTVVESRRVLIPKGEPQTNGKPKPRKRRTHATV